jgi:hypothetical protein
MFFHSGFIPHVGLLVSTLDHEILLLMLGDPEKTFFSISFLNFPQTAAEL